MTVKSIWRVIERLCGRYPLYLAAFCIQIPLVHYEIYSGYYYDPLGTLPAIGLLSCLALLFFATFRLALRDTQLAGLAALIVLLVLFPKSLLAAPVYPIIGIAGVCIVALRIAKRKGSFSEAFRLPTTFVANISVVAIFVLTAVSMQMGVTAYRVSAETNKIQENVDAVEISGDGQTDAHGLPDIVHIVLDGYSRADVLQSSYNFDNSPFLSALADRGFRILGGAQTPYNQTLFVMSSIFSLGPIDGFMTTPITDHSRIVMRRVLAQSVREGPVLKTLNQLGYHLQTAPSSYLPLQLSSIAETVANGSIVNPLELQGNLILSYDLIAKPPILNILSEQWFDDRFGAPAVNFRLMQELPNRRFAERRNQPRFIYQHILAPHPPFNITADGSPRKTGGLREVLDDGPQLIGDDETNRILYREGYLEKLRYVNRAIVSHIDYLQKTRTGPLIIILHGDHGGGLNLDPEDKAKTCARERFSPLFAVYASDSSVLKEFNPDFNLVNTYRAIFRAILNSDLPDQPNRSKFVSWELDAAEVVHPEELTAACAQDHRTIIADRPTPSAGKPSPGSVPH